ncbi:copper chaperone [Scheffersomyces xylosifermentans]|uniref:copper chaperone n=1 Tax=Scheffersomyces xylosifermentans TaxID=1304137 RepID=UPI00315C6943
MTKGFEIVLAVPMECQSCVDSVSSALSKVQGINQFKVDLEANLVTTEGTIPPSTIVKAIQSTGRDAIIRGTGKPNTAAVCILESFDKKDWNQPVKGLARIVSVSPTDLFVDLTVNGLPKGTYYPSIRQSGNLSEGALSTGALFYQLQPVEVETPATYSTTINALGASVVDNDGKSNLFSGQSFLHANLSIDDLIGRSVVLSKLKDEVSPDSLCGVIARSAGVWENDKQICSCSGKTVWQERADALSKGISV